jgi:hypothetical protein
MFLDHSNAFYLTHIYTSLSALSIVSTELIYVFLGHSNVFAWHTHTSVFRLCQLFSPNAYMCFSAIATQLLGTHIAIFRLHPLFPPNAYTGPSAKWADTARRSPQRVNTLTTGSIDFLNSTKRNHCAMRNASDCLTSFSPFIRKQQMHIFPFILF